ncbi:hypothetical protein AF72_02320 [Xylella taiwanensis]|uniref:Uncharacterized protein n=1 Tax=Xylella taiwanensis TaxID=1444770 RepID=Z9JLQ6_9GAMM|nr:hypothetical protein AF72_02320 [Xylella taiwanensis]
MTHHCLKARKKRTCLPTIGALAAANIMRFKCCNASLGG